MRSFLLTLTMGIVFAAMLAGTSSFSPAEATVRANNKASLFLSNQKEILIQVADADEKSLPLIRSNIEQSGGMAFKGYCKKMKVLLYLMDTNVHADLSFLNVAFVNVSMGYLIKEGTVQQVQNACDMSSNIDPDAAQE
ncbi:hypothetical protein BH11BAC7_BH11BAC7_03520 [soil metagenome]